MPVFPLVLQKSVGTIDTRCVAVGRYLNLDPVQGRAAQFVQLSLDPFKHCDLCGYTSEHSTHEKEKNYHESTECSQGERRKNGKHEKSVSNCDGFIGCDACMCRSSGNHPQ
ncbi:MAG: hypothetical protein BA872_06115 [Desulfobacterales bacterium C00003060]|nr:MAG: hypothetical protein BA861_09345 [Desulfobacterales bacterium S3730MH5]OEU77399.1 MAG: hypothetical protein BA872_06115 [Desulfobacterales bacterium C00003060]OEU81178.1 MAG: hypothetical protein BA865_01500 [Desulfobacterales bacterium S5133MH4]